MSNLNVEFLEKPEHLKIEELHNYWQSKCQGQAIPSRQNIIPADIPHLLPNLWFCEVIDETRDFKFRLFGTELVQVLGEERTGKRVSAIGGTPNSIDGGDQVRQLWHDLLQLTFRTAKPIFVKTPLDTSGRSYLIAHMIALPLLDRDKELSRIMGGVFFKSTNKA